MNLSKYLEEYKTLTLALINEARNGSELTDLIQKREEILESISILEFDKEEIESIESSLKLLELEEELQNVVKKEKVEIKKQIENLKKVRQANVNYNSFENKAMVFNKSV
ncbi:hypothetical protein [Clostridium chromiireducens]|uniref:Flagellar protein FliT n=1 Tax=Clostridium chromiireducens TaxID=225345 RepID=A0A1V4IXA3_9CLOT|nr:hypothetical protein [Clostridium chromiireducens]OPJ64523.1 hypothetical protein CLCHR_11700 [Clostridium chromiireducens]